SNAREDLPDPLTPVTTVIALCGISTETFFRLWTRARTTRRNSCCSVRYGVVSLVAKGKLRQRASCTLPKPQIIRAPLILGKCVKSRSPIQFVVVQEVLDCGGRCGGFLQRPSRHR